MSRRGIGRIELITKHYFRADEEGVYISSIGGLPARSLAHGDWMDSVIRNSDFAGVQDVDVDVNADGNITVGEIDQTSSREASEAPGP